MPSKTTYYVQWVGAAAMAAGLGVLLWRRELGPFCAVGVGALLVWLGWYVRDRKWL